MTDFNQGDKVKIIKLESKQSKLKDEGEIIKAGNDEITVKLDAEKKTSSTNIPSPRLLFLLIVVVIIVYSIGKPFKSESDKMNDISTQFSNDKWGLLILIYSLGVSVATFMIHFVVQKLVAYLLAVKNIDAYESEDIKRANIWGPALVGICEQILYPTSLIMHHPEFIGIWLGLKVAGQWGRWSKDDEGRRLYNKFLIGNALSIMFGILTYVAIKVFVFKP